MGPGVPARPMSLAFDVFWSFRSPYSYLATPRLLRLASEYDVEVNVRVVLPIAVRIPGFFETVNPLWPPYLLRDTMRIAEYERIPYGWPRPDPIVQDFATREVAAEQPYIYRLTRLGVAAAERGRGLPFVAEVSSFELLHLGVHSRAFSLFGDGLLHRARSPLDAYRRYT